MEELLSPGNAPFVVSLALMLIIAAMEGVGLLFGMAISSAVDSVLPDVDVPDVDLDIEADIDLPDGIGVDGVDVVEASSAGVFVRFLGWLSVGRVPILVLMVLFLTIFGLSGLALQSVSQSVFGDHMPALLAVVPALALALPGTRHGGLAVAKVMPKEETEAVSSRDFIGQIATITAGVAKRNLPAQAKLQDRFGKTHYVFVEPIRDDEQIEAGSAVILTKQDGGRFLVVPREVPQLEVSDLPEARLSEQMPNKSSLNEGN